MLIRLLGPVDVVADGVSRPVNGLRRKGLLAVLALHHGGVVSNDRLAEVIWAGDPPATSLNTMQRHISHLRQVLGRRDAIVARPPGYRLDPGQAETDVAVAEELIRQGTQGAGRTHAQQLREALALWRGQPLADVAGLPWLEGQGERLEQLRLRASRALAQTRLTLGEHAQLTPELEVLVKEHPFDEQLHAQLMIALYRGGRQADALAVYRRLRRSLLDELGIEPGPPVRDLQAAILGQDTALDLASEAVAAGAVTGPAPRQLPRIIGDFTGREVQLRDLAGAIPATATDPSAVLVLTGTAGIGKTALAVHFAHQVADRFPDGQLFTDLRGHSGTAAMLAAEVLHRFLRALGLKDVPGDAEEAAAAYRSRIAGRRLLILLDNVATADQVRPLLPGSAGCLVLVTSRSRLPGLISTESATRVAVGALGRSEGMTLMRKIIGARRVEAEQAAAAAIVSHCAGLPLALRVAAERVVNRPVPSLTTFAAQLADEQRRLDILTSGGDERATMRSVFSWSYRSLSEGAARVFRLLGLHPGPEMSAPAVAALARGSVPDVVRALDQLTGAHLAEETSRGRYRCHDLLRAYAAELAGQAETPASRARATRDVLTWYLHTADAASREIGGERRRVPLDPAGHVRPLTFAGYDDALAWCDTEQSNLTAAAQRAAEAGFADIAWKIPAAASDFFRVRRPWSDWIASNTAGLAAARESGDIRGQACSLNDLGSAYHELARHEEAAQCFEETLRLVRLTGDRHDESAALNNLGEVYLELPRTDAAVRSFRQSLDLARQVGDRRLEAVALDNLGDAYRRMGCGRLAIGRHREALDLTIQIGNRQGEAQALRHLGQAHRALGQPERSRQCYLDALQAYRQAGDRHGAAETHARLGDLLQSAGRALDAREHWHRALTMFAELGDPRANQVRPLLKT